MINIKEKDLLEKFANWKINELSEKRLEMVAINSNHEDELLIIAFLYKHLPNEKWSFYLEEDKFIAEVKIKSKYTRMYTSGCFDIFHYGHLNILAKSKEICDYLIVGVSTDELIEKEKGKRPIIPFKERMEVVKSIGLVDEVIAQTDKDKQRIVETYQIDAISVGSDWKGRYPKVSCAMEYFPYTANVSSTILRDALKLK